MTQWFDTHYDLIVLLCWVVTALSMLTVIYPVYESWQYKRRFRRHLTIAARAQARYAVFDSWIRGGGRRTSLGRDIELVLREEYAAQAKKNGPAYFATYEKYEQEADGEIERLMQSLEIKEVEDEQEEH